jgi:2-phospho-L-lactate guanylyltransferase (CobY/MobA/RfbA family)
VKVNVTEAAVSLVDLTDASDLLEATILAGDVEATTTLALMQAQVQSGRGIKSGTKGSPKVTQMFPQCDPDGS